MDKVKLKVPDVLKQHFDMLERREKEREKYYGKSKFALLLAEKLKSLKINENIIINTKGNERQGMSSFQNILTEQDND